jgi:hypothetical protein
MTFTIPAIEEFEREFENEEKETSSLDRWPLASPERISSPIKKQEAKPIKKWKSAINYGFKPVIFRDTGTGEIGWLRDILLKRFFNEEKLLAFEGDPEDENFVPLSKETLERAVHFLIPYFSLFSVSDYSFKVLPGPDGSIDILWKNSKRELLVNIPADKAEPASFYGDDFGRLSIKGKMETSSLHPSVLMWLINS